MAPDYEKEITTVWIFFHPCEGLGFIIPHAVFHRLSFIIAPIASRLFPFSLFLRGYALPSRPPSSRPTLSCQLESRP